MIDPNQKQGKTQIDQNREELNNSQSYITNESPQKQYRYSPQIINQQPNSMQEYTNGNFMKSTPNNTKRKLVQSNHQNHQGGRDIVKYQINKSSYSKQNNVDKNLQINIIEQASPNMNNEHDQYYENENQLKNIRTSNKLEGKNGISKSPQKKRSSSTNHQYQVEEQEYQDERPSDFTKKSFINKNQIQDNTERSNNHKQKNKQQGEVDQNNQILTNQDFLKMRILKAEKIRIDLQNIMDPQQMLEYLQNHQPHSNQILNIEDLNQSAFLRLKRYKQCVYYGEQQNKSRTGKGIMIYYSGRLYEGDWQNDSKFGKGFELYPNGSSYEGYFVNGKPEGFGTYMWYNGEVYDGEWINGMKHGSGQWMGVKGDSYSGEWKFGKADGKGIHKWINGDIYEGEFKCYLKHGKGKETFSNGDVYIGQYANGRPEGQGDYFWKDGAHYKGQFKNGLRHGQGLWRKKKDAKNTDQYEGEYVNDKRCGYGIFTWASGNQYRGEYFEDFRHGYGEMHWTDSSYYKGEWDRGIQCGEGELFIPGEGIKKGTFVNNIFKQSGRSGSGSRNQQRTFKTISEENYTPRGVYQGSNGKGFMPHSQDVSTAPITNYNASGSNLGQRNQFSPPSVTDFTQKLPNIKSYNNTFDVHNMNGPKRRNQQSQTNKTRLGQTRSQLQQNNNPQKRCASVQQRRFGDSRGTQTQEIKNTSGERVRLRKGKSSSNNILLPPLSQSKSPNKKTNKPKKLKEILLKKHEIILWKEKRLKLNLKPRELRDFTDQRTVDIIRGYLHPPIWYPSGVAHCLDSSSPPRSRSHSPNISVHNTSQSKRYSRIL